MIALSIYLSCLVSLYCITAESLISRQPPPGQSNSNSYHNTGILLSFFSFLSISIRFHSAEESPGRNNPDFFVIYYPCMHARMYHMYHYLLLIHLSKQPYRFFFSFFFFYTSAFGCS